MNRDPMSTVGLAPAPREARRGAASRFRRPPDRHAGPRPPLGSPSRERWRPRRNSASPPSSGAPGSGAKYKTELCNCYAELGFCDYGSRCQFAHGPQELQTRPELDEPRPCVDFLSTGFCSYGRRCNYSHRLPDGLLVDASVPTLPPAPGRAPSEDSSPSGTPKPSARGAVFPRASLSVLYHSQLVRLGEPAHRPASPPPAGPEAPARALRQSFALSSN